MQEKDGFQPLEVSKLLKNPRNCLNPVHKFSLYILKPSKIVVFRLILVKYTRKMGLCGAKQHKIRETPATSHPPAPKIDPETAKLLQLDQKKVTNAPVLAIKSSNMYRKRKHLSEKQEKQPVEQRQERSFQSE